MAVGSKMPGVETNLGAERSDEKGGSETPKTPTILMALFPVLVNR